MSKSVLKTDLHSSSQKRLHQSLQIFQFLILAGGFGHLKDYSILVRARESLPADPFLQEGLDLGVKHCVLCQLRQ